MLKSNVMKRPGNSKNMNACIYFFMYNDAFLWNRMSTLSSWNASNEKISFEIFSTVPSANTTHLIVNRFTTANHFDYIKEFVNMNLEFLFDIDDNIWELPEWSLDPSNNHSIYINKIDYAIKNSKAVIVTSETLKKVILTRFPGKSVYIVRNVSPEHLRRGKGVFIANTDNFKMNKNNSEWFSKIISYISDRGLNVLVVGKNQTLYESGLNEFLIDRHGEVPYLNYLNLIREGYTVGLIPIDKNAYSDCKSDIKLYEMTSLGMTVVASQIEPYKQFRNKFPQAPVILVENEYSEWKQALDSIISNCDAAELETGKIINQIKYICREEQFTSWKHILNENTIKLSSESSLKLRRFFLKKRLLGIIIQSKYFLKKITKIFTGNI